MPDDQVDVLLADARRLSSLNLSRTWPPKFVGMIKDGPEDGSSPEYIDSVLGAEQWAGRKFGNHV